jgi:HEAT repeat protein
MRGLVTKLLVCVAGVSGFQNVSAAEGLEVDEMTSSQPIAQAASVDADEIRRTVQLQMRDMKQMKELKLPKPPKPPRAPHFYYHYSDRRAERNLSERDQEALMAVEALMLTGKAKATPTLKKVLAGTYADEVKSRALFVLTQVDPPAAEEAIVPLLAPSVGASLQCEAMRTLAAGGTPQAVNKLYPLLEKSNDEHVQDCVLRAFRTSDRNDLLAKAAKEAKLKHTKLEAIQMLGAAQEKAMLLELYATKQDDDVHREIAEALGKSGDLEILIKLANTDGDVEVREDAVRRLSRSGQPQVPEKLLQIYRQSKDDDVKEAVIDGLQQLKATKEMVNLYREEKSPEMKRRIIRTIATNDPDAAIELIDKTLK